VEVPWTKGRRKGTAARAEDKGHSENAGQHPHEATSVSRDVELEDRHDKRRVGGDVEGQTNVHGPTGPGLRHKNTTQEPVDGVSRRMRRGCGSRSCRAQGCRGTENQEHMVTCRVIKYGYWKKVERLATKLGLNMEHET
jgi:hypothetical protein